MVANPKEILARFRQAQTERMNWESLWDAVARYVRPECSFGTVHAPGSDQRQHIYDDTAVLASNTLAGALDGLLTNSAIRWFMLVPADPSKKVNESTRRRLFGATNAILAWFDNPESGFGMSIPEVYRDLTAFGTGCVSVIGRPNMLPRLQSRSLSSIYLEQNDDGEIEAVHRLFKMSGQKLAMTFPDADLSRVESSSRPDEKHSVIHSTYRRYKRDPYKVDSGNMPWASCYVLEGVGKILSEGGFPRNPYLTPRWDKTPEEVYGRSPSIHALTSIRSLNATAKQVLQAGDLAIRPPMMAPANGMEGSLKMSPGAVNYMRAGMREKPEPLVTGVRPDFGDREIERRSKLIERHFYVDRLQLPDQDRMTAAEIYARQSQGMVTFSPIIGRLISELLHPLVMETYIALSRLRGEDLIDLPPSELAVAYTSPLAGTRDAAQSQAFDAVLSSVIPLAQANPAVLDVLDEEEAVRRLAQWRRLDPEILRTEREVAEIRAARQQAQQAAAAVSLAEQGSVAVRNLSSARSGDA